MFTDHKTTEYHALLKCSCECQKRFMSVVCVYLWILESTAFY